MGRKRKQKMFYSKGKGRKFTPLELVMLLTDELGPNMGTADWRKPLVVSSDEEGNSFRYLYGVEIGDGEVILWPAELN